MTATGIPAWVRKRDGRVVPFEADKITHSLFAATEELGRPNAFLAREMTDGALHFLAQEVGAGEASSTQVVELVAKVVRELGQPELAHAYERRHLRPPEEIARPAKAAPEIVCRFPLAATATDVVQGALQAYSLQAIYSRDLAAAREEGLLVIGGLDHPDELAAAVVDADAGDDEPWEYAWQLTRDACAATAVFDSPEYVLDEPCAGEWLRGVAAACAALGRRAVVHVNTAAPPPWAASGIAGPLFGVSSVKGEEDLGKARSALFAAWNDCPSNGRIVLSPHFHEACPLRVDTQQAIHWVLDRPRREPSLGAGLDRQNRAILLETGLSLPHLLARPDVGGDPQLLLAKLPSLARMGVRAGAQKRKHLRRRAGRSGLSRGFLLDRARLVLVPLGLDSVVTTLLGQSLRDSPVSREFAGEIVKAIAATAAAESRSTGLDIVVGAPQWPEDWRKNPDASWDANLSVGAPLTAEAVRQVADWCTTVPGGIVEWSGGDPAMALQQFAKKTEITQVRVAPTG